MDADGKEKLARAQGELAKLRDTIQVLSKEHASLQAKHDAFAACKLSFSDKTRRQNSLQCAAPLLVG